MHAARPRMDAWDYARGIGIVLVVYGHVLRGLQAPGVLSLEGTLFGISDFAIYCFHMPLFFVLAGMNSARQLGQRDFLGAKAAAVLVPYALWTVLQASTQALLSGATNTAFHIEDIPDALVFNPYGQFWFLYALFVCHFLAWLGGGNARVLAAVSLPAYVTGVLVWLGPFSVAFRYLPFYAAGVVLAPAMTRLARKELARAPTFATATAAGSAIWLAWVASGGKAYTAAPVALPAAALGICLVLRIAVHLAARGAAPWLRTLGRLAMPIYLLHVFAGSGTRILLLWLGIRDPAMHLGAGIAAGLLFPVLGYRLLLSLGSQGLVGMRSDVRR